MVVVVSGGGVGGGGDGGGGGGGGSGVDSSGESDGGGVSGSLPAGLDARTVGLPLSVSKRLEMIHDAAQGMLMLHAHGTHDITCRREWPRSLALPSE